MNWAFLLTVLILSAMLAAAAHRWLSRRRPQWSPRRRTLTAAMTLPGVLVLLTVLLMVWELVRAPGSGEDMQDLAIAALAFLGTLFTAIATAGGFIGAALARRGTAKDWTQ